MNNVAGRRPTHIRPQSRYTAVMNASAPPPRFHLGIVTGLDSEAEILRAAVARAPAAGADSVSIACHGPGQERGLSAARSLLDVGATALLSFGVAGGCNPDLPSGAVVLSTGVRDMTVSGSGEFLYTNREWQRRLKARLLGAVLVEDAPIASVTLPATAANDKQKLFADLNVAAVDMESAAVARAAMEAGAPFMALRAVLDHAAIGLPPSALAGLAPDGASNAGAVIRAVLRRPHDIPALIGLAAANTRANRALNRAAMSAAPLFGAV